MPPYNLATDCLHAEKLIYGDLLNETVSSSLFDDATFIDAFSYPFDSGCFITNEHIAQRVFPLGSALFSEIKPRDIRCKCNKDLEKLFNSSGSSKVKRKLTKKNICTVCKTACRNEYFASGCSAKECEELIICTTCHTSACIEYDVLQKTALHQTYLEQELEEDADRKGVYHLSAPVRTAIQEVPTSREYYLMRFWNEKRKGDTALFNDKRVTLIKGEDNELFYLEPRNEQGNVTFVEIDQ